MHSICLEQAETELSRFNSGTGSMAAFGRRGWPFFEVSICRADADFMLSIVDQTSVFSRAYHMRYKCSGIRHCQYAHPDVLRTCPEYDRVKLEDISKIYKRHSRPQHTIPVEERIRIRTEAWYNGYLQLWNKQATCKYPDTNHEVCRDRQVSVFRRNKVCACSAYAEHMLTRCCSNCLPVALTVATWSHGIELYPFPRINRR